MPHRLRDIQIPAHPIEFHARRELTLTLLQLQMICSGVCRPGFLVVSVLLSSESHNNWTIARASVRGPASQKPSSPVRWLQNTPEARTADARVLLPFGPVSLPNSQPNLDDATVRGFGEEWSRFDQSDVDQHDLKQGFDNYFSIIDLDLLDPETRAMDVGCGSGRWARFVAPRVGHLHLVDPSAEAL